MIARRIPPTLLCVLLIVFPTLAWKPSTQSVLASHSRLRAKTSAPVSPISHDTGLFRLMASHSDTISVPEGTSDCFGLVKKMCVPCPSPEQNNCEAIESTCNDLFCAPMCLANTLDCEVTAKDLDVTDEEKKALCAQVIGHACASTFKCCKSDSAGFLDWVEGQSMDYATPLLPIASCKHDPKDEAASKRMCNLCQEQLGLKVSPAIDRQCHFGGPQLQEEPESKDKPDKVQGVGAMKSYQERCLSEGEKVGAKAADIFGYSGFGKQLCTCAGCCAPEGDQPTCFYPLTSII